MKMINIIFALTIFSLFLLNCGNNESDSKETINVQKVADKDSVHQNIKEPVITFVELGSVNCIPCRKMQPVMKAIEDKYSSQIKVIFYDIWKADQKKYAEEYKIRLIPTQVFIDKTGKEIFRHEGFFPEKEIDVFLQKHGLKPKTDS